MNVSRSEKKIAYLIDPKLVNVQASIFFSFVFDPETFIFRSGNAIIVLQEMALSYGVGSFFCVCSSISFRIASTVKRCVSAQKP